MSSSHFKFKNLNITYSLQTDDSDTQKNSDQVLKQNQISNINKTFEILDFRNDFLMEEEILVKGDKTFSKSVHNVPKSFSNFESVAVLNKSQNVCENFDNGVSTIISDTELIMFCDIVEEQNKTCTESFTNLIAKQISEDFCELECNIEGFYANSISSKIPYKKKIKRTYSNRRLKPKCSNSLSIYDEQLSDKANIVGDTPKIDLNLSQPIVQNLLELTTYFFCEKSLEYDNNLSFNKNFKRLEDTKIVLDLQTIFDTGNALFYGNLFENDDLDTAGSREHSRDSFEKETTIKNYFTRKNSSKRQHNSCNRSLILKKAQELNEKQLKFLETSKFAKQEDTKTKTSELCDLWSDEKLLQNISTHATSKEETKANFVNESSNILKNEKDNYLGINKNRKSKIRLRLQAIKAASNENTATKVLVSKNCDKLSSTDCSTDFPGFMTASRKKIQISQRALDRAKLLVEPEDVKI